jgi:hypothetical protein
MSSIILVKQQTTNGCRLAKNKRIKNNGKINILARCQFLFLHVHAYI